MKAQTSTDYLIVLAIVIVISIIVVGIMWKQPSKINWQEEWECVEWDVTVTYSDDTTIVNGTINSDDLVMCDLITLIEENITCHKFIVNGEPKAMSMYFDDWETFYEFSDCTKQQLVRRRA